MRVLLLSDVNSIHTKRWATALRERGVETGVFSFTRPVEKGDVYRGVEVFSHRIPDKFLEGLSFSGKLRYLSSLTHLKKVISSFRPDIVHAHYASNYGTLGALSGFHPFILSVWGSDIYKFPRGSKMKEWLIRRNLEKADRILSTSQAMAEEAGNYTKKRIGITPFGIDLEQFRAYPVKSLFREGSIVIGTVKALEKVYGIEILIDVFSKLRTSHPELPLKLLIAGSGSQETSLKRKSHDLGLDDDIVFTGRIPHDRLSGYLNMMDIFVALSLRESFGVAVIEASACELPVVVTNIGGLKEVVEDRVTGLLVPPENAEEAVVVLEKLIFNPELGKELGRNGRNRVKKLYDWNENVSTMIAIYQQSLGA